MDIESLREAAIYASETAAGIRNLKRTVHADTYHPELPRKSTARRWGDNILWLIREHEANGFYALYGLDVAPSEHHLGAAFISNARFTYTRNLLNIGSRVNHSILLRDKRLFGLFMEACGVPVAKTLFYVRKTSGNVEFLDVSFQKDVGLLRFPVFLKGVRGECADSVHRIGSAAEISDGAVADGFYLAQEPLAQDDRMKAMGAESVNTCRIVTVFEDERPKILSAVLRCGTSRSGCVDNWARGGVAVGVTEDGTLRRWGYLKPKFGGRVSFHPDTGVPFEGFEIPFWREAVHLAEKAQLCVSECPAIGWDIAITPDGPVLIEGNDNWEISFMQACNGGLKAEWEAFVAKARR